jgi:hypothetical protein
VLGGILPAFDVLPWVIVVCALTMAAGTAVGGWRIIKTMGLRLTKLEPMHGFAAETAAGLTIQGAAIFGIPLSTTHTISTAIMGVGATRRLSAVRWGGRQLVAACVGLRSAPDRLRHRSPDAAMTAGPPGVLERPDAAAAARPPLPRTRSPRGAP